MLILRLKHFRIVLTKFLSWLFSQADTFDTFEFKIIQHYNMIDLFAVPSPVQYIFDIFPLQTYGPISKKDDVLDNKINERKYYFQENSTVKNSLDDTCMLGVYNVFEHIETKKILATDPWCLFVQFSLSKKNSLQSPTIEENHQTSNSAKFSIGLLSYLSVKDETLPVLVEGHSKRYIRPCSSINESINAKLNDNSEELLYMLLLDKVVYDCWITQVFYHIDTKQFLQLYAICDGENASLLDELTVVEMKKALLQRNSFHLRQSEIVNNISSPLNLYARCRIEEILSPIFDDCKKTLLQFEELLTNTPKSNLFTNNGLLTHLNLKISSYILTIGNLPESTPLKMFVQANCPSLISNANDSLSRLNNL